MSSADSTACQFAQHLVARDYAAAHAMICPQFQAELTAAKLQNEFEAMMDDLEPMGCQMVMEMEQWPGKIDGDLGWVYLAIEGDVFSEAVTVVVCRCGGIPRIRQVDWGRP